MTLHDPSGPRGLRLVVDNGEPQHEGPRRLAPGAPPSDGPLPLDAAAHLQHGEVLVWWGRKDRVELALIGLVLGVAVLALAFITAFAPGFWSQPLVDLLPPVGVALLPTAVIGYREWVSRSIVLVTDLAVTVIDRDGAPRRLPFGTITAVRRDWLHGGMRLDGHRTILRIPTRLADPARAAIRSRLRGMVRGTSAIDDRTGWLA